MTKDQLEQGTLGWLSGLDGMMQHLTIMLKMKQFLYMTSGSCKAFESDAQQQSAAGTSLPLVESINFAEQLNIK